MVPVAKRIFVYFVLIALIAAVFTYHRGGEGVTTKRLAIGVTFALLGAALVWLRWDWAPRAYRECRDGDSKRSPGVEP